MQVYINKNGQQLGAFEAAIVVEMLRNGQFSPNDLGIRQGENQWQPLGKMFPNAAQTFSPTPAFNPAPLQTFQPVQPNNNYVAPKKSSNGLIIGLLAVGAFVFLGIIGLFALFFIGKSNNSNPVSFTNTSTTNSTSPKSTPKADYTYLSGKAPEFSKLKPTLKLESKAVLKGKTLILEQRDKTNEYSTDFIGFSSSSFDSVNESELSPFGLTKEQIPDKLEDLETLVQIVCGKGGIVGKFGPRMSYVPAYANTCKISLINYKESKIFFQKTIQNAKKPVKIYVKDDEYEYILERPTEEIQKYVKGLPKA